jgi:hypothetical protein
MAKYLPLRPSGERPIAVLGISDVVVLESEPKIPVTTHLVSAWGRWVREVQIPDVAAERIRQLTEHFDLVWASEWGHNAHTAFRPALGLPEEPWPFLPVQFDKLAAIRAYAGGMPWVWIDDPVVDLHEAQPGAEAGAEAGGAGAPADGIIVRVDPHEGIAGVDVAALVAAVEAMQHTTEQQGASA